MNSKAEKKITMEVTKALAARLKLNGHDYFALSPMTKSLLIIAFQTGAEYWQNKIEEVNEKLTEF